MNVTSARLNLAARQVEKARASYKEEKAILIQIRDYLSNEDEINSRIEEYAKVLTRMVRLCTEFPRTSSRDREYQELDPPTVGSTVQSPQVEFSNLIASVSKYHDGYVADLKDAKAEMKKADIVVQRRLRMKNVL